MIKYSLIVLGAVFLCTSCAVDNWPDTVITNNSSETVAFKFNNTSEFTLTAGDQAVFTTKAYQRLEYHRPEKRVYFTYEATDQGYTGGFSDRESWTVEVTNALSEGVTLSAGGWMDDITFTAGGIDQGKIYTPYPEFTVTTTNTYPAIADWELKTDGKIYVTIHR
jgi:hypothetical protein